MRHLTLAALALAAILRAFTAEAGERWLELPEPPAMQSAVRSGIAQVNGIDMYYAVYGASSGTPILMIHGGLGYADIWANQVLDLSKDHTVVVADTRGHGRSTRNDQPYSYDLLASDYIALLDYLKIATVDLVGWSDGGIVGIDIAMRHPERLNKLFAHAANTKAEGLKSDVMENKTFQKYIERSGEIYVKLSPTPNQYDSFVEKMSAMWESQPNWSDADIRSIGTPTAIVLGDHDEVIDRTHTDYIAGQIPGKKLVILKDVSHFAMLQDPSSYNAAIRDFFDAK